MVFTLLYRTKWSKERLFKKLFKGKELTCYLAYKSELPTEKVDMAIISGSKASAYDTDPWVLKLADFIKTHHKDTFFVGICFGHQLLAESLGGKVQRMKHWEAGPCLVQLNTTGQKLFKRTELAIHQMHRDEVTQLPEGMHNIGSTEKCSIQGMVGPNVFSVQGHPELPPEAIEPFMR
jgi:GMP synthase-like glutamine amidotransferase